MLGVVWLPESFLWQVDYISLKQSRKKPSGQISLIEVWWHGGHLRMLLYSIRKLRDRMASESLRKRFFQAIKKKCQRAMTDLKMTAKKNRKWTNERHEEENTKC